MVVNAVSIPLIAMLVFAAGIIAGHRYRKVWKQQGPRWQLWLFGSISAACLLVLAFIPIRGG
ncbi:MAG: hypothetical protein AAF607_02920 [Pseudomonadota bacterium]